MPLARQVGDWLRELHAITGRGAFLFPSLQTTMRPISENTVNVALRRLGSVELALRRIDARVRQGGHDVPKRDVVRRFKRGWENFQKTYQPMAESWAVFDNSGASPQLLARKT